MRGWLQHLRGTMTAHPIRTSLRPGNSQVRHPARSILARLLRGAGLALVLGAAGAAPSLAGVSKLTDNALSEQAPKSNAAGQAAWSAWDGNDYEIFFWDGTQVSQLTTNNEPDRYPAIASDGQVAWMHHNGTDWDVWRKSPGQAATTVTNNNGVDDLYPRINATTRVVWLRPATGGLFTLHKRDGTGGESQIAASVVCDHDTEDWDPQLSSGGHVVWVGSVSGDWQIFRWNGSTTTQLSSATVAPPRSNTPVRTSVREASMHATTAPRGGPYPTTRSTTRRRSTPTTTSCGTAGTARTGTSTATRAPRASG